MECSDWFLQQCIRGCRVDLTDDVSVCVSAAVRSASQWAVCVAVAVLCVTVLMLPLHTDSNSLVPRWLHVSTNQKLVCAYTLGNTTHTHTHTRLYELRERGGREEMRQWKSKERK